MEQKHIYKILQELSFSEYEAKAYLALLAANEPLSGYAVALQSGVPRSRIYDILSNLEKRGDIIASHVTPAQYLPVSPDILLKNRKKIMIKCLPRHINYYHHIRKRFKYKIIYGI